MRLTLYSTVLHLVMFHGENVFTYEQKGVPQSEAEQECSRRGSNLVNYKEIQANPSASKYLDQLENGGTAWIGGYAELSPFLYWQGCYSVTNVSNVYTFVMEDRSLFMCSKECLRHDSSTFYVGVKDTTCYCIESDPDPLPDMNMFNPSVCNISCSNNGIASCGGDFHMDLYGIRSYIIWGQNEPANRQCVYYILKEPSTIETYTASCHTVYIDGFVCTEVEDFVLANDTCTNTSTYLNTKYCFMEELSTRHEAYKRCLEINGQLTINRKLIESVGLTDHTYGTSYFRSLGISDSRTSNSVCIAATKINNIFYVEPDNCSVEKYFLCKYNELAVSGSVSHQQISLTTGWVLHQTAGITKSKHNSSRQAPRITKSQQDSSIHIDSIIGYISLAVSVVGLAVAVIVTILLYKFKKWKMGADLPVIYSHYPAQRNNENNSLVSNSRYHAVRNCENRSTETQSKHLTEQSDSQIPRAESSFVEEERHTVEMCHVYEGLLDDRQHATYEVISQSKDSVK